MLPLFALQSCIHYVKCLPTDAYGSIEKRVCQESDVSHCYNLYYVPFQQDKEKLVEALLDPSHNTEKVIYFLLLDRKKRRPCYEDETELGRMRFNAVVVIEFE